MYHNIVLIGMMGSGKSSVGRHISEQHDLKFLDTDALIEEKINMPISEFFTQNGEGAFRELEEVCCQSLLNHQNHVIATGGGLVLSAKNRACLRQLGLIIYLETDPETLLSRLEKDQSRPLLNTTDKSQKIKELIATRDPIYKKLAHKIIPTSETPAILADQIWRLYQQTHPF
jgi:shikimate kinase